MEKSKALRGAAGKTTIISATGECPTVLSRNEELKMLWVWEILNILAWLLMAESSKASGSGSDSGKKRVMDLESQNTDGAGRLRELLASSADPIQTIREFQEKNDIKVLLILGLIHCAL